MDANVSLLSVVEDHDSRTNKNRCQTLAKSQALVRIGAIRYTHRSLQPAVQVARDEKNGTCTNALQQPCPNSTEQSLDREECPGMDKMGANVEEEGLSQVLSLNRLHQSYSKRRLLFPQRGQHQRFVMWI